MLSSRIVFFLYAIFISSAQAVLAQSLYPLCSNDKGNYTANGSSTYEANLNHLLSSFSSDTKIDYGFYNSSYGQNSDQVYAIGLCRGDVNPDVCRGCLKNATSALKQLCPNQKEAIGWYDYCMLRYSNHSIYGVLETTPDLTLVNTAHMTASIVHQFNDDLRTLMESLSSQAVAGGPLRKFATGNATAPEFKTLYGLVQCTPDLSEKDCSDCLREEIEYIPECCERKIGLQINRPSCKLRFEVYQFYFNYSTAAASRKGSESNTSSIIIVPTVVFVVIVIGFCIYVKLRKPRQKDGVVDENRRANDAAQEEIYPQNKIITEDKKSGVTPVESLQFDFGTIRDATNNFSEENKLGQGGFGVVYKGMLSDGQVVAVKRLSMNSGQGDLEFKNEVLLVAKLQHRNLVRLLGFCLEKNESLLIYEFMPNISLDHFLFDPIKRTQLDWGRRYKIIKGIARGIFYLHEDSQLRIIHRDLKASNILLDAKMNPKISDFGMAKLFLLDQTQGNTSRIVGTRGYMAPEYAMYGQFSTKSDVFSFGILILEIISGKKNNYFRNGENVNDLLSDAWKNWTEKTATNIVDPTIRPGSEIEIMRCIHIGLLCIQENVADRPTMDSVILNLNSYSITLPVPSRPALFMPSNTDSETTSQWEQSTLITESNEISKGN